MIAVRLGYRKAVNGIESRPRRLRLPGALSFLVLLAPILSCGEPPPGPPPPVKESEVEQAAGVGRVVVDWQRSRNPPIRVLLGVGGIATGPSHGPFLSHLYPEPGLAAASHLFSRTYAPFRVRLLQGEMAFRGRGAAAAGPVEQRMIVEWARGATASLAGGESGSYGLALSWHRGGSVGSCESISVFVSGEAAAEACAWGAERVTGRLQPTALGRVYAWFDALGPFQDGQEGSPGEVEPARLIFAGRGTRGPTPEETAEIEAFAASLLRELAARRGGGAPVPAAEADPPLRLLVPQETPSAAPPLARLAPAVPPSPPAPVKTGSTGGGGGGGGSGNGSTRRSGTSQPLR